jgi:hypothetical protein
MTEQFTKKYASQKRGSEIFIDPPYAVYNRDNLFNLADATLNRDGQLLPYHRLREHLLAQGKKVRTADYLLSSADVTNQNEYFSLGLADNYRRISADRSARLAAFIIMEPPVVAPQLYAELPALTSLFDHVYVHNTEGHGYSLDGVDLKKLRRFYWPIPYLGVLEPFWNNRERLKRIVVINGSHNPKSRFGELYSARIHAMAELAKFGVVDLYGRGWDRWWSRNSLWWPYWSNIKTLMSIYKGSCHSKYEVLQHYDFCLCFENMAMNGWITEKIFDCLYVGTIPLYLGAPDISKYIPTSAYIDCRNFTSPRELWKYVSNLTTFQIQEMRDAGKVFLKSEDAKLFFASIDNIVGHTT